MSVRSSGLALLAVAGIAIALSACSFTAAVTTSAPATASAASSLGTFGNLAVPTAATTTAAAIPAGYHRVGGPAQGISLAVPSSWVSIDLANQTIGQAAKELAVPGFDAATAEQDMQALEKDHAIFAYDLASSESDPNHFARNINAYCLSSGVNDTGSSSIPFLKQESKAGLGSFASGITQREITIGGVPGIESSYEIDSATQNVYGSQLEVLPKPDVGCFVTLSYSGSESPGNYLAVAAATAEFP